MRKQRLIGTQEFGHLHSNQGRSGNGTQVWSWSPCFSIWILIYELLWWTSLPLVVLPTSHFIFTNEIETALLVTVYRGNQGSEEKVPFLRCPFVTVKFRPITLWLSTISHGWKEGSKKKAGWHMSFLISELVLFICKSDITNILPWKAYISLHYL